MLQLTAGVACCLAIGLVACAGVGYIFVGACPILYRIGEVVTMLMLFVFGTAIASIMVEAEEAEETEEECDEESV